MLPRSLAACVLGTLAFWSAPAVAQWTDSTLWGVHGNVAAVARVGNTLYVGGSFNKVGPNSGGGVLLDRWRGEPVARNPRVAGAVKAVVPDGNGGWFIGGTFSGVGGLPRSSLAHVLRGGRVAAWSPEVEGTVYALVLEGNRLYLGGSFSAVGGVARANLAAVDVVTGRVLDWRADAGAVVHVLALGPRALYVGGNFTAVGDSARISVAALDPASGTVLPWNPNVGFFGGPGSVRALAVAGDTVYVGGDFVSVGAEIRHRVASIDAVSGLATSWDPDVEAPNADETYGDPYVFALAVRGASIYVGGGFEQIGGVARPGFAELDRITATVSNWNPLETQVDILSLSVQDSTLLLSGGFTTIAGQPRRFCAELDLRTGLPTPFSPRPDEPVTALAACRTGVYVGGYFFSVGQQWRVRRGLAAFDLTTGAVRDWDPDPVGFFTQALLVTHGKLYVGGEFITIAGQPRYNLAAFDTATGELTDWNPIANSVVYCLTVAGDTLYAGGDFTTVGGQARGNLASFDLATGELTDWNPDAHFDVYGLSVSGGVAYVTGFFWRIGGLPRNGLAAVDAITGAILPWDPEPDKYCYATAVVGDTVFVAGCFSTLGGQPRQKLAAVDRSTGLVLPWIADADNSATALAVLNDTLLVGGAFTQIAGERRGGLAALELKSGAILPWDPDLGANAAWSESDGGAGAGTLTLHDRTLYFGGGFWRVGLVPATNVAAISFGPPPSLPPRAPTALLLAPFQPNPVRTSAIIRYALPADGPVNLDVFDLQGRRVASLLRHVTRPAGIGQVSLAVVGWREGFYFCRLEAAGSVATRKFVVLR